MSQLDKDKLQQEMSTLPLSTISTTIAAASTSTAAAASSSFSAMTSYNYSSQYVPSRSRENLCVESIECLIKYLYLFRSSSTSNPAFLSKVITGAVNEVLSSSSSSSSSS